MKRILFILFALLATTAFGEARITQNIDFDWRFHFGEIKGAEARDFNDADWRKLDLPHDWSIEAEYRKDNPDKGAGAYLPAGIGWYRRIIDVPAEWQGKHVRVEFDAAQRNSDVWINGQHLGNRPYGYISFSYDLTPHLKPGRNILAARLDNPLPAARWYTGSGIYSHLHLVTSDKFHIPQWGTFIRTDKNGDVHVVTDLTNHRGAKVNARLISEVEEARASSERTIDVDAGATKTIEQTLNLAKPREWSPEDPQIYRLKQRLYDRDTLVDEVVTTFGFRTIRWEADTGFWLNEKNIKLKGVGIHYDASPTGVAIPDEVLEDRLHLLKQMGCNAVRTGHTPFPPKFYDLCDRLGLMVMDEFFDGWRKKVAHDYGATAFDEWWKRDLTACVLRDRNHPSIIIWSIGNETGENDRLGMTSVIKQLDPTRTTTGGNVFHGVGVSGFNGPGEVPGVLEKFHRENPEQPIVLTEETHGYQTRGFYRVVTQYRETDMTRNTPFEPYGTREIFFDGDPQFRSSYDNAPVRLTSRQCWKRTRDTPWISGEFRWAGFDYLGEGHSMNREWPARYWHPGIIDSSGIPKDTAYFYQSQWTSEPMVHLLPHWTHPTLAAGTVVPVVAYSNCEEVELFLNKRSLGRQKPRAELLDFVWQVPYEPGEIRGCIRERQRGRERAVPHRRRGFEHQAGYERRRAQPDRRDVATVTFSIRDEADELVPYAMDRVEFKLHGPAHALGYENGNNTDVTPNHESWRNAFYGMGRGFFQATSEDGPIELVAAGILGGRELRSSKQAAMAVARLSLRGTLPAAKFAIHFTNDGSEPTPQSPVYEKPFSVSGKQTIRMLVLRDGQPELTSRADFAPASASTAPVEQDDVFKKNPHDKQLVGTWVEEGNRRFRFEADGRVLRLHNGEKETARWWYDYPDDEFEETETVGTGQIRWSNSQDIGELRLSDRSGKELIIGPKNRRLTCEPGAK